MTSDIRVAHVLGAVRRSGAEMMLASAGETFSAMGVRSAFVPLVPGSDPEAVELLVDAGYELLDNRSGAVRLRGLPSALSSWKPDVVHVHPEHRSAWTTAVLRVRVAPTIRTIHSVFEFDGVLRHRKRLERALSRRLGVRHVAVSHSIRQNELERFANPTLLVENWFGSRRVSVPSESERTAARARLGLGRHRVCAVIVGNCGVVKRHDLALHSLARCPPSRRPVLLHAGDESAGPGERELARTLGIDEDVKFLGSVADVGTLLHAADVFVMTSSREGTSVAAIEAAACGVPLILTDVPGLRDLAALGPHVTLVAPTVDAISAELMKVQGSTATDSSRRQLAAAAHDRFNVELGASSYASIYRAAARRRIGPSG